MVGRKTSSTSRPPLPPPPLSLDGPLKGVARSLDPRPAALPPLPNRRPSFPPAASERGQRVCWLRLLAARRASDRPRREGGEEGTAGRTCDPDRLAHRHGAGDGRRTGGGRGGGGGGGAAAGAEASGRGGGERRGGREGAAGSSTALSVGRRARPHKVSRLARAGRRPGGSWEEKRINPPSPTSMAERPRRRQPSPGRPLVGRQAGRHAIASDDRPAREGVRASERVPEGGREGGRERPAEPSWGGASAGASLGLTRARTDGRTDACRDSDPLGRATRRALLTAGGRTDGPPTC